MAFGSSIKMYLTIFIATTCMYMVLYQYHISRQPMPQPDIRHKDKLIDTESTNGIGGSYITSSNTLSSNKISSSTSAPITSSSSSSSSSSSLTSNATNLKAVKLLASNKSTKTSKSSSALTNSFKLLSLPSGTSKLFKSMNIFLWSPMSLLSSSSASAANPVISKKSSLYQQQQQHEEEQHTQHSGKSSLSSSSSSPSKSSLSSSVMALNNTLLLTTSTSSSSTTSTVASTTTRLTTSTTTKSNTKQSLSQTTIVNNNNNNDKLSAQQQQQQLIEANLDTPPLYIITPTYRRPEQLAELTRLGYTLKHVMNLLWLVIEDANKTSELVLQTLNRIGVPYEYFLAPMPEEYKKTKKAKPRGVSNRNRGLKWLRENATEGVFYFADDDNTYDISIFEQMRYTKKVSMWPVGLVTKYGVSSPIIKSGKIIGFYDGWIGGRKYPVDMAGFAVSVKFLHDRPEAKMPFKPGYEEDGFLKSLAPLTTGEIELLASNCTEILTWHTQTKKNNPADILNMTKYGDTNLVLLDSTLVRH